MVLWGKLVDTVVSVIRTILVNIFVDETYFLLLNSIFILFCKASALIRDRFDRSMSILSIVKQFCLENGQTLLPRAVGQQKRGRSVLPSSAIIAQGNDQKTRYSKL